MHKNRGFRISTKAIVYSAVLAAMSIVLGKLLQIPIGNSIRLSFENLPILFAGIAFGPLFGGCVGLVADLVGCLLVGYAINPIITAGAVLIGVLPALVWRILPRVRAFWRTLISVLAAHLIASVLVKSLGLYLYFGTPFSVLIARLPIYLVIGTLEAFLIYCLKPEGLVFAKKKAVTAHKAALAYEEALAYIHRTSWKGSRLGLSRIRELLSRLGNPQRELSFIHVAGTNGKGSVCAMLTSVLGAAGYRVGCFCSPFIEEFRERIRIGGAMISERDLCAALQTVRPHADAMADAPTEFELITALAAVYFKAQRCDVVVWETGLGGALDSTNVIEAPLCSVITSVALDHTAELGSSIEKIARAKAGIIKPGCPVLFGAPQNTAALSVIRERAEELGAPLTLCVPDKLTVRACTLAGSVFDYGEMRDIHLSLLGTYQPQNAMIVIDTVRLLRTRGMDIPEDALRRGLETAAWKGRFARMGQDPTTIFDGAHNPAGAKALCESLEACFPGQRAVAVLGVMADKDYGAMLDAMRDALLCVYAVAPQCARALDATKLAAACGERNIRVAGAFPLVEKGVAAAFREAKEKGFPLLVFGSLYLYQEAAAALRRAYAGGTSTTPPSENE